MSVAGCDDLCGHSAWYLLACFRDERALVFASHIADGKVKGEQRACYERCDRRCVTQTDNVDGTCRRRPKDEEGALYKPAS